MWEKSSWVNLSVTFFYQKYLECCIVSFHTCVIFFYLSSRTSDRNNLLMPLPYFYLDSGQNFGCSILLIKKEADVLKYYPKTLQTFFCEANHYISVTVSYIFLICTFYFFPVFHGIDTSKNE